MEDKIKQMLEIVNEHVLVLTLGMAEQDLDLARIYNEICCHFKGLERNCIDPKYRKKYRLLKLYYSLLATKEMLMDNTYKEKCIRDLKTLEKKVQPYL